MGKYADGWVLVRDGAEMLRDGAQLIIEFMEPQPEPAKPTTETCNLNNIKWTQEQGARGAYEKATDQDNIDFRRLINELEAHDGKLQRDDYFYWKFSTGNIIGRKPQK